jgi:hypothetical protein
MHVRKFHQSILDTVVGSHPRTDYFLERLKLVLLKENPDGRRERHGFEPAKYDAMCARVREYRDAMFEMGELREAFEYHEIVLSFCAIYEPAARIGEMCPGKTAWNPARGAWTKNTLRPLQLKLGFSSAAVAVLMPQPQRKTEYLTSHVTQARVRKPLLFLIEDNNYHFLLAMAVAEGEKFSPVDWSHADTTTCFRKSRYDNTPLDTSTVSAFMQAVYAECFPESASQFQTTGYGARIGRIRALKAVGGSHAHLNLMNLHTANRMAEVGGQVYVPVSAHTEELMNAVSGHTKTAGRNQYDTHTDKHTPVPYFCSRPVTWNHFFAAGVNLNFCQRYMCITSKKVPPY